MHICDKHKTEKVFLALREVNPEDVCISSVTYAELVYGVEKSSAVEKNRIALSVMLSNIKIVDFDSKAADEYGKIRADLERKGIPIGPLDMLIAAHARSLGYTIVTNNVREFIRVEGLEVANWAD